ncbi:hypothetical protein [Azospirillum argentinense]
MQTGNLPSYLSNRFGGYIGHDLRGRLQIEPGNHWRPLLVDSVEKVGVVGGLKS